VTNTPYGSIWFDLFDTGPRSNDRADTSLRVGTGILGSENVTLLSVVPNTDARFPRARHGEVGLEEGWGLARAVRHVIDEDNSTATPRAIVVVIDVPSQAYGYTEELLGVHQALAAAVDAFASARQAGHPVIGFIVGKAISGAFLATGLQANRLVALDHPGVAVQVMSKQSAARITRRTVSELDDLAVTVPATAYDVGSFQKLGAIHALVQVSDPAAPSSADKQRAEAALAGAIDSARAAAPDLSERTSSPQAQSGRAATILVDQMVGAQWNAEA
jgi:biotin-independent malonate decarboxylase gamma subunit